MERRKFVIGLGALATGSAAAMGTGAFSSITADRDHDLTIAGDENAYLGLEAGDNDYVNNNNNLLTFDFTDDNGDVDGGGDGINNRADTVIGDAFTITNQSDRDLYVWASFAGPDGSAVDPTSGGARSVELVADGTDITYPGGEDKSGEPETSRSLGQTETAGAIQLGTGDAEDVDLKFLVYGSGDPRDSDFRVVFHALDVDDGEPMDKSEWMVDVNDLP